MPHATSAISGEKLPNKLTRATAMRSTPWIRTSDQKDWVRPGLAMGMTGG